MSLRYPGEIELRRGGSDEGEGRGFDNLDLSAGAERTVAAKDASQTIVMWFVDELTRLGWSHDGDGWLSRDEGERFFVRVERDQGASRVGASISDPANRHKQERFEESYFFGAPEGSSVVTLFFTVAPEGERRT